MSIAAFDLNDQMGSAERDTDEDVTRASSPGPEGCVAKLLRAISWLYPWFRGPRQDTNCRIDFAAASLETRFRIQEGSMINTVRLECDHPIVDKLKETGVLYDKAVHHGHTMGLPHFYKLLCLMH